MTPDELLRDALSSSFDQGRNQELCELKRRLSTHEEAAIEQIKSGPSDYWQGRLDAIRICREAIITRQFELTKTL